MVDQIGALTAMIDELGRARSAVATSGATAAAGSATPAEAVAGPSFTEVLAQVTLDTAETLRGAEASAIGGLRGQASTIEVVEAIKEAEQALATAIAVRDKAVEAYQEISRMAI